VILIVEGVNGTGKTTLVEHIVATRGFQRHKPFFAPSEVGVHSDHGVGAARLAKLAKLGVPVNSHVEDLFLADFYGRFPALDVVLDRSMPSAIAYKNMPSDQVVEAFEAWRALIERHGRVAYVTLTADYCAVQARLVPERTPKAEDYNYISEALEWAHSVVKWPKLMIDTSARSAVSVRREVADFMDVAFAFGG
jgi:hypothetical protein